MEQITESSTKRHKGIRLRGASLALLAVLTIAGLLFVVERRSNGQQQTGNDYTKSVSPIASPTTDLRTVSARIVHAPAETQMLSGILEARHTVTVSAEVAARIVARPIERGKSVAQGSIIATFDDRNARATVAEAQAALSAATAQRRQAEAEYDRARTETASAIDSARASVISATAGEKRARTFTRSQELRQAESSLVQAESDENLAKIERDRYARLVAEGAVAQQTLDRVQATYESAVARTRSARESVSMAQEGARQEDIAQATAQVQTARAGLDSAKARPARLAAIREQIAGLRASEARAAATLENARVALSKYRIASPLSGRVLETRVEAGEMASPGAPVAVLANVRELRAIFAVPESTRPQLKTGQRVTITSDALPGKSFPAQIALLAFQGDGRTRAFRVEVAVANPNERLLPNMTARLSLPVGKTASLVSVPVSAVATDEVTNETFVIVVGAKGETKRTFVTLGEPIGADAVWVRSGLHGGEQVAAEPSRVR